MNNMDNDKLEPKYDSGLEDRWETIRKEYRKEYPNITDEDVDYRTGEFDMLAQNIARRTNRSREEVSEEIRSWQL
ncbi:hypothetical protein ES711_15675 [Gelidibacter salicanalis]|uniref:General stress protein CsbD n=1 Tax=Gelidibacter salicanalis TaxID=291193 RepID=A0A5C7AG41_9FLAO|nr:hypothetical protein [Gelidibacter salicanalis]TXE05505.1 hypothetical protein ES711_15675 [Gelidibacter salicanalis]